MDEWIGKQIDDMLVMRLEKISANHVKHYRVKCVKCGNEKIIQLSRLKKRENTKHDNKKVYLKEFDPSIGLTINDHTITERLERKYRTEHYYKAECNICGITFETTIGNFKRGYGTSHKECTYHLPKDKHLKRFRKIYACMRYRTTNPNYPEFHLYGGRGISSEYYNDFIKFYKELFQSYKEHAEEYGEKNTTIDRINVNGNYEVGNVRWATCREQAQNKRK